MKIEKEFRNIEAELRRVADPKKAKLLQRFFKTGKGEYGEGDVFLGITVPKSREIAIRHTGTNLNDIKRLLQSEIHEERLVALLILVDKYKKCGIENEKKRLTQFYLSNATRVNNWDLVDLTAHRILGEYLRDKNRQILYVLSRSDNVWKRRISIIATFAFINKGDFKDSLRLAKILLGDKHDLIRKAVGWVLREIGKKDAKVLREFLRKNRKEMSRVTLRYAIEKFPKAERDKYMKSED